MRCYHLDPVGWTLLGRRDQSFENVVLAPRQLGHERAITGKSANGDRFRRKDADDPSRRGAMGPKHRERIGIARRRNRVEVLLPRSPILPHECLHDWAQLIGTKGALQISLAYSAIVRSEENQPTLAVFRTLERSHRFLSHQASSIFICAPQ